MNIEQSPNHRLRIEVLRRMSPEDRLLKAFELSEFSKQLFVHGLQARFPHLNDDDLHAMYLERLGKCHNRNY